ncbi:MAG: porin [Hyphomicrobium sp.]
MNKYSLSALVAAGLLAGAATSASAADLGGNCCADLEERIAELEATTARKGNRKVSLTISGWVNQQITYWDNGEESNIYIHDLGSTLGSHVKFTGQATISPGWSAGYVLHIESLSSDGLTIDEISPHNGTALGGNGAFGIQTLQSYWFVKSESLGKVSVGLQSQASDNAAILVDGSGSLVSANWVAFDTSGFSMRLAGGGASGATWGGYCGGMGGSWGDCNGATRTVVRYDSPSFGGFSMSASWGEDDMWDVAGRYAGEFAGFKLAAVAAYNEVTDESFNASGPNGTGQYFQAGVYLQHVPTGLFALGNYGQLDAENGAGVTIGESESWYVKAGVRTRLSALGHTVFYGEYQNTDGDNSLAQLGTSSETEVYGAGIVQEVDAAAMSVWLKYRNLSYEDNINTQIQDFDYVGLGAIINF